MDSLKLILTTIIMGGALAGAGCDSLSRCPEGGIVFVVLPTTGPPGSKVSLTLADRTLMADCPGGVALEDPGYFSCNSEGRLDALVPKLDIVHLDRVYLTIQKPNGDFLYQNNEVILSDYSSQEDGNTGWCKRGAVYP